MSECNCGTVVPCFHAELSEARAEAAAIREENHRLFLIASHCQDIANHDPGEQLGVGYVNHSAVAAVAALHVTASTLRERLEAAAMTRSPKPRKPRKPTPLQRARALARSTWKQPRSPFGISRAAFDAPHFGVEPWTKVRMCLASLALDGHPAR